MALKHRAVRIAGLGPKYGKAKYAQNTAAGPTEHHYPSSGAAGAAGAGAALVLSELSRTQTAQKRDPVSPLLVFASITH